MVALFDILTLGWTARRRARRAKEAEGARQTLALLQGEFMIMAKRPGETAAMHRARSLQALKRLRKIARQA